MAKDISGQIMEILEDYADTADEVVREVIPKVAKAAVKRLKSESPRKSGEYAKGWTQKVEKTRLGVQATVYNKAKPGLAHLLEFGHAKRGGGRTKASPHIEPVNEWVREEALTEIEEALR